MTPWDRLLDLFDLRCPLWGDTVILAGVTAFLCALGVLIGERIG